MAEVDELSELRLGPTSNPAGLEQALREIEDKINQLVRAINELTQD